VDNCHSLDLRLELERPRAPHPRRIAPYRSLATV
jgi:hypothetical protein